MIPIKTEADLQCMRESCAIVAQARELARRSICAGMTTRDLDELVYREIVRLGAKASFYKYAGFPGHICVSINEEVVHGIPGDRVIKDGDLVKVDIGAYYRGFHSDTADTFAVGKVSETAQRLIDNTRACFEAGVAFARSGARLGDLGHAVAACAAAEGFSPVRSFTGHGIGKNLHEDPAVLNYGKPGTGDTLRVGMVIAIEPMINVGTHRVVVLDNDWTVVTKDNQLSAHYEHTVAVTESGPEILTA